MTQARPKWGMWSRNSETSRNNASAITKPILSVSRNSCQRRSTFFNRLHANMLVRSVQWCSYIALLCKHVRRFCCLPVTRAYQCAVYGGSFNRYVWNGKYWLTYNILVVHHTSHPCLIDFRQRLKGADGSPFRLLLSRFDQSCLPVIIYFSSLILVCICVCILTLDFVNNLVQEDHLDSYWSQR